jgi:phage terminase large subunit-like protein
MPYDSTREVVEALRAASPRDRAALLAELEAEEIAEGVTAADCLRYDWSAWGRPEQQLPPRDVRWRTLTIQAGRGGGKTRAAAEMIRELASDPDSCGGRIALIAPTYGDIRITMIEGESGILAISPPWDRPEWNASHGHAGRLRWKSGVEALCFTAKKKDSVRGPQFGAAWLDEWASYGEDGLPLFGLLSDAMRLGNMPKMILSSTPKHTPLAEYLHDEAAREEAEISAGTRSPKRRVFIHRQWSTLRNADNLPADTIDDLHRRYDGTTIGRQELGGELLRDDPDALWSQGLIDRFKRSVGEVPEILRIVVGVDNALTVTAPGIIDETTIAGRNRDVGSADTGIIAVGEGVDGHFYVLQDATLNAKPLVWGTRVIETFASPWDADPARRANFVFCEQNAGYDLIKANLAVVLSAKKINPALVPIRWVNARDGKWTRAGPIHALYEQGRVHHVQRSQTLPGAVGGLVDLEFQMTRFKRGVSGVKKDRVDALVWAITALLMMRPQGSGRSAKARAKAYT